MKTRTFILSLGILIVLISCAKKNYVTCEHGSDLNLKTIDSKIIELQRIGIADTTLASISGNILVKSINKTDTLLQNIPHINIWVKDIKTDSLIGTASNSKGEYQFTLPASEYDLAVQYIGFNILKIKNVKIESGDIINFSAIIGQGSGETVYKWLPNGLFEKLTD